MEYAIIIAIVAVAALVLTRRTARALRSKDAPGCCCGCSGSCGGSCPIGRDYVDDDTVPANKPGEPPSA
jgi:hypothetical protein